MAQLLDPAAATFALQPSFLGRQRDLGPFSDFGPLRCLADQGHQAGNSVLAVLLLGAKPPSIYDQITLPGHTISGQTDQAFPNVFGEGRRMGHIETELHCRGDLIHILAAGAGGANELLMNFFFIDRDGIGNPKHTCSVPRVQKCRSKIPRTVFSRCHSAIPKIYLVDPDARTQSEVWVGQ